LADVDEVEVTNAGREVVAEAAEEATIIRTTRVGRKDRPPAKAPRHQHLLQTLTVFHGRSSTSVRSVPT